MGTIRELGHDDWADWRALWAGYLDFYRAELPDDTSRATFDRLCAAGNAMFGLIALDDTRPGHRDGQLRRARLDLVGRPKVLPRGPLRRPAGPGPRRRARPLEAVKEAAAARGADPVYWHTQQYNGRARSLYDQVGRPTSFVVYEM